MDTDAIHSKRLRELYAYWRSKAKGCWPSRADIDPAEIPHLLPYVFLVDVERDPQRFRFRLIGTQICAWSGRDVTGMYVDDPAYGPRGPEVIRQYAEVIARGLPFYIERPASRPERDYAYYDRIALPLAQDGRTVDMLLCAADMLPPSPDLRAGRYREMWDDKLPE
ncbi:MAG TPA: PAS domain-containing protein [Alphaproteobacteria bacterium]|nr:PAS domain-containing protein [Alphaproteobacteria bacterium]